MKFEIKIEEPLFTKDTSEKIIKELDEFTTDLVKKYAKEEEKKKVNPLVPKIGDEYWDINIMGEIECACWDNDIVDNSLLAVGNVFLTEQACEKEIELRKAIQRIKMYIFENDMEFIPDWEDGEQNKCYIYYGTMDEEYSFSYDGHIKQYQPYGYLASSEDCKKIIQDCEKELDVIFEVNE